MVSIPHRYDKNAHLFEEKTDEYEFQSLIGTIKTPSFPVAYAICEECFNPS